MKKLSLSPIKIELAGAVIIVGSFFFLIANTNDTRSFKSRPECIRSIQSQFQRPYGAKARRMMIKGYQAQCASLPDDFGWPALCANRVSYSKAVGRWREVKSLELFCAKAPDRKIQQDPVGFECMVRGCWKNGGEFVCQSDYRPTGLFGAQNCASHGAALACLTKISARNSRFPGLIEWGAGKMTGKTTCRLFWLNQKS